MHLAYLNLVPDSDFNDSDSYIKSSYQAHELFQELKMVQSAAISVIQRAPFNKTTTVSDITYYFIKDEFESTLRWWQEPAHVFQQITDIQPDLLHVYGLNLPLQFRWLRRIVGDKIIIIGEHTGETIWAQRNLWLQQFGLRIVDGFIFKNLKNAHPWTKASVILEKQPVIEIPSLNSNPKESAKLLVNFYNKLITTKNTKDMKK